VLDTVLDVYASMTPLS